MILHYYQDPGHGWVKIKRETLCKLGILAKVSHFSYQRGDFVYLEEDCDVSLLYRTMDAKGQELALRASHTDKQSKIRSYASFGLRPGECV